MRLTLPSFALPVVGMQVKRWNFCCVKWSDYIASTSKFEKTLLWLTLPDVEAIYQNFFNAIRKQFYVLLPMLELLLIFSFMTFFACVHSNFPKSEDERL